MLDRESQQKGISDMPPSLAFRVAAALLQLLVNDDGPTPQIAPTEDAGTEINWLVNGDWARVDVDADGDIVMEAGMAHDVTREVDSEFPFWRIDESAVDRLRHFLTKIGEHVQVRSIQ